jgi:hypothetical protein
MCPEEEKRKLFRWDFFTIRRQINLEQEGTNQTSNVTIQKQDIKTPLTRAGQCGYPFIFAQIISPA